MNIEYEEENETANYDNYGIHKYDPLKHMYLFPSFIRAQPIQLVDDRHPGQKSNQKKN